MAECGKEEFIQFHVPAALAPAVSALMLLSPSSRGLVVTLLEQLAEREGFTMSTTASNLPNPLDGLELWSSKLKQESYSPETIRVYSLTIKRFLREHPQPSRLNVQQWLARELEEKSASSVSTSQKALKSMFGFLQEEGLWPTDPTAKMKSIKVKYRAKDAPTLEEVILLLSYECRRFEDTRKYRMLTLLIATTALRVTEAASLRRDRVFFDKHEIRIVGKGDKERVVPLVPAAEYALMGYMAEHENGSPYVFPGDTKTGWMSAHGYEKALRAACVKLSLRHYTPHSLRHFFATYTLQQGAKLEVVSRILGHASVSTTADIYRHVLPNEMHETSKQFGPVLIPEDRQLSDGQTTEGEFTEVN